MISPAHMELHMGILQNRMKNLKGRMNVCMAKMNMEKKMQEENEVDPEKERLRFLDLDKQYQLMEEELAHYEDKALAATNF